MCDRTVVALEEVLAGNLPVRVEFPLQAEAVLKRVEIQQLSKQRRHLAEGIRERVRFRIRIDEHERSPCLDCSGNESKIVRVELGLAVGARRGAQPAVETVRPCVVRALQRLAAPFALRDGEAAMSTYVEKRAELAVTRVRDDYRNLPRPRREVRARLGHLRRVAGVLPAAREDPLRFGSQQLRVAVPAPRQCSFHSRGNCSVSTYGHYAHA
jgi:hypothetical protein